MRRSILVVLLVLSLVGPSLGNEVPTLIEIEVQFVEFNLADIESLSRQSTPDDMNLLSRQNMINIESLMALWKDGKARLLAAPRTVTKSGSEATVKGVTEYIYPTEFSVPTGAKESTNNAAGSTNAHPAATGGLVEPGGFQTREVGAILSVLPELSPDGALINLTLTPEYVCHPIWKDYGPKGVDATGKMQQDSMEQPFFHVYTVATQIALKNGATIMIGGGINSRDNTKMVYIFVSARSVDAEGKPLKRKN